MQYKLHLTDTPSPPALSYALYDLESADNFEWPLTAKAHGVKICTYMIPKINLKCLPLTYLQS